MATDLAQPPPTRGLSAWDTEIDGLRGLAAFVVVIGQARAFLPLSPGLTSVLNASGTAATASVIVFFVLSGYCIHLRRTVQAGMTPRPQLNVRRFYWRRLWRLYPTFFTVVLAGGVRWVAPQGSLQDRPGPRNHIRNGPAVW